MVRCCRQGRTAKSIREHQLELNNSLDPRRNHIKERIAWVSGNSDTCEEVEMIVTGELEELDNDPVNQGC